MEKELISVIVPIYNVEAYLRKSIDSILNQTYRNLEIILVDDGGTDNCPAICDEYAKKDERIKVIHKKNGGLSDARNAGTVVAKGNYIGFIDSDDFISPDMYEKMLNRMKETEADIVVCNFSCVRLDGTPIVERNEHPGIEDKILSSNEAIEKLCGNGYEYWVTAWNRLYKADIAKKVCFPKGKIHEDEFTAHLFYQQADRIAGISEPFYQYVIREDSIMTKKFSVKNLSYVEALNGRILYCMEHEMAATGQAFLRWMAKYLIQAYGKLNMSDESVKNEYFNCERLFWRTYKVCKKEKKIDGKTRLVAMMIGMPKPIAKLLLK